MTPDGPSSVRPRVMGAILSIASCFIISTNLLVAAALLKLVLKKRSQSWCFVLNLALADALVGVAITGLATEDFNSNNVAQNQRSLAAAAAAVDADPPTNATPTAQGKTRCLMRMAFVTSPCTASIMSMFLISLDRYAAIKMPLRYSQLSGKVTAVGSLLALWISALTMGFLPGETRDPAGSHSIGRDDRSPWPFSQEAVDNKSTLMCMSRKLHTQVKPRP